MECGDTACRESCLINYAELTRKLRRLGCEFYRQAAGSREIWWRPSSGLRTTISNHGSKDIPKGTLRKILRDLDITPEELRKA